MRLEALNGYINPFSKQFRETARDFHRLKLSEKIMAVVISIFAGLPTLPFLGVSAFAAFRMLVKRFKKIDSDDDGTTKKTDQTGTNTILKPKKTADTKKKKNEYTANIFINRWQSGWIGTEWDNPSYHLTDGDFTLEDGSPIPLDSKDFFLILSFDVDSKSEKMETLIGKNLYPRFEMPASLFKGKKNGDRIRLRYKGQLIELTINQKDHFMMEEKAWSRDALVGKFEDFYEQTKKYCEAEHVGINSYFQKREPITKFGHLKHRWYNPANIVSIFGLKEQNGEFRLKEHKEHFIPIHPDDLPNMECGENHSTTIDNKPLLKAVLTGCKSENIEIILTKKGEIHFFGLDIPCADQVPMEGHYQRAKWIGGPPLEKMKTILANAKVYHQNGIVFLVLPLN